MKSAVQDRIKVERKRQSDRVITSEALRLIMLGYNLGFSWVRIEFTPERAIGRLL